MVRTPFETCEIRVSFLSFHDNTFCIRIFFKLVSIFSRWWLIHGFTPRQSAINTECGAFCW